MIVNSSDTKLVIIEVTCNDLKKLQKGRELSVRSTRNDDNNLNLFVNIYCSDTYSDEDEDEG